MHHEQPYQQFLTQNPYPRELKNIDSQKNLIDFSSSDYLGLAKHPLLIARSQEYASKYGVGATASRLVTGNFSFYAELEHKLAKALGKPAALILGSGYQANVSILEALFDADVLGQEPIVFCDRLCHVSMLTMTRHLTRLQRFQHNNLIHLQELLEKHVNDERKKFILVESIYSMEGDETDFEKLISLAKQYRAFLYVDDAHAVGVYGPSGFGKAAEYADDIDIIMGTFSKALGSFGAYIGCSEVMRHYFINKCRGIIYSTGLSPSVLGAIAAAVDLLPQLDYERAQLQVRAKKLREFFRQEKLDFGKATTHIVPWIIGDAEETLRMSKRLLERGIVGVTIRPPSVPAGKSRIRFCLSAKHSDEDIERLMESIFSIKLKS